MKKINKWIFSEIKNEKEKEKSTNAEKQKSKKESLLSLSNSIDSIQSQFMTSNDTERNEEFKPLYERIHEINSDYKTYYKNSPNDLVWSTVEEWDNYIKIKESILDNGYWTCYEFRYPSPTFLDFVPR